MLVIVLIPILYFSNGSQAWQNALYLIIRSVLILMIWYFLLAPFLMKFLNKILSEKRVYYQTDVQDILTILPTLKLIIYHSWSESKPFKGFSRLSQFLAKSIAYSLYFEKIKK